MFGVICAGLSESNDNEGVIAAVAAASMCHVICMVLELNICLVVQARFRQNKTKYHIYILLFIDNAENENLMFVVRPHSSKFIIYSIACRIPHIVHRTSYIQHVSSPADVCLSAESNNI